MRRSVEVLESRLATLYRLRNIHNDYAQSALRAPGVNKAAVRENVGRWESRWDRVHARAWALWLEAGGARS